MKRYIHVYTGNGKGKTTAALGLALRAAGADLKVFIGQFLKRGNYSEIKAITRFSELITAEQFGGKRFIRGEITEKDKKLAAQGLKRIKEIVLSGNYDLVILDEINVAMNLKLLSCREVLEVIESKPANVEMVLTGRSAPDQIIEKADLVTEMKLIKHYFSKGIKARKGIER